MAEIIVEFPIPLTEREKKLICGYKGEIVRCKECKYFYKASKYCSEFMTKDEDGFCKWGERGEDG